MISSVAGLDPLNLLGANMTACNNKRERLSSYEAERCLLPVAKRRRPAEQPQPTTTMSKGLKKTVSFSTEEQNQQIEFAVSHEEKHNAWYNRRDYREFREDMQATALSVRLGITDLIQPEDFCLRGLEANVSPKEGTIRKLRRMLLIETIIQEQVSQKTMNNGAVDAVLICALSRVLSADALLDAAKRAWQDAIV